MVINGSTVRQPGHCSAHTRNTIRVVGCRASSGATQDDRMSIPSGEDERAEYFPCIAGIVVIVATVRLQKSLLRVFCKCLVSILTPWLFFLLVEPTARQGVSAPLAYFFYFSCDLPTTARSETRVKTVFVCNGIH